MTDATLRAELEAAVLTANFKGQEKPVSLYKIINSPDADDESVFIDAVNRNLRRGRIVVLVVGDGIRTEAERLAGLLQSHAGFHFTFALVELAVYQLPTEGQLLVYPRILAKTELIRRGVVEISDHRAAVKAVPDVQTGPMPSATVSTNISREQFLEAMERIDSEVPAKLERMLNQLEQIGVYPEFKASLNMKWDAPNGRTINFGYVEKMGG